MYSVHFQHMHGLQNVEGVVGKRKDEECGDALHMVKVVGVDRIVVVIIM